MLRGYPLLTASLRSGSTREYSVPVLTATTAQVEAFRVLGVRTMVVLSYIKGAMNASSPPSSRRPDSR